jgi:acyl CoA:acetate/3-ketoacid CoA transferase beta subunit
MSAPAYKDSELLICLASRLVEDGSMAFIGTGIPMLAASLAQRLHAPNLVPVFEFGGVGAVLEKLPLAVGDMRTFNKALFAASICEVMETGQRGFIEYGFIGGAQIDAYGNLNTTVIGPQDKPKVRLPVDLAHHHHHEAGQEEVRREDRLHHHARLPHRPWRARESGPAAGLRAVSRGHQSGRHGL